MTIAPHLLSASDRRGIINRAFVERPGLTAITDRMDRLREGHREGAETACMLIVGDPGVGKSKLLERYAFAHGNNMIEERTGESILRRQPVVYAQLDSNTTVIGAAETILKAMLGAGAPTGSNVRDTILPTQLGIRRTELLIIDEFQHVAETGATKTRSRTADWVKSITKKLRIPVVMAGMPTIDAVVADNPQLSSITPFRFAIPSYDFTAEAHKVGFCNLLKDIDEALPFLRRSGLGEPERAARLHLASGGVLRHLGHVLASAGRAAIDDNAPCIDDAHFFDACEDVELHPSCPGNPFPEPPEDG